MDSEGGFAMGEEPEARTSEKGEHWAHRCPPFSFQEQDEPQPAPSSVQRKYLRLYFTDME
jgi:hypothetical protein